ncbi:unnamed protein product, partial [Sphacelaria rigidula]
MGIIILDKVTFPPLVRHIDMLASPSQAWNYIVQYNRMPGATEKAKLEHDGQTLQMADGELPMNFLSRAQSIRTKREEFDVILSDCEATRHIVRCLSSEYEH